MFASLTLLALTIACVLLPIRLLTIACVQSNLLWGLYCTLSNLIAGQTGPCAH